MISKMKPAAAGLALCALLSGGAVAESHASMDWTKSKYGPDDEIGAANLLTPDRAKAAAGLVTTGKTYSLGLTLDSSVPAFAPRSMSIAILQPGQVNNSGLGPTNTTYNDDIFMGWLGIGSQIDGLGHIGDDHTYYNGNKGSDFVMADGMTKLGIEKVPPMVTRGVLLNMAKFYGKDILDEGTAYTREDITAAAEQQGVEIREGDVVLFHSGWLDLLKEETRDATRYGSVEPGLGKTGAEYLAEIGVVAVGADTWGLEAVPFEEGVGVFEVHQILLAHNGIYILENMVTEEMAADGVTEFMFVLGQAKVRGAVQMIINPVAIR
ncbi:cyclase family protein [Pseudooceanicola onchidii]|uniref:cyclase family protein n=1 Tax=Pseudooceanicola onchidii TaxID=2562279 RepID=UPI001F111E87|nr:cyclase family protein [Pseudooceanicola onchidii]